MQRLLHSEDEGPQVRVVGPLLGMSQEAVDILYCLICKEVVDERYTATVKDTRLDNSVEGFVCRECFNTFIKSLHNEGYFKIYRFVSWMKGKKDKMRY
jgi:hypothetical protein